ncbi:ribonuclease HI family protein [Candidatus Saccharibacteria bacterium]|jgi:ribonuclease HI|nr:ribonuclease HI family protein [Candidatus Saccharibacteria bacterium]
MTRQEQKEEATKIAIKNGLGLFRRELTIFTIDIDGSIVQLSQSDSFDNVWSDALSVIRENSSNIPKENYSLAVKSPISQQSLPLIIHTDGGSRGNPGPSASGFVIETTEGKILEEGGEYLGITTNNQAEYQAVKLALERATSHTDGTINFYIDSMLVVNQMKGIYKIKNRDLWPIHNDIKRLSEKFSNVTFTHVPREKNKLADAKVNEVLDSVKNAS